MQVYSSVDPNSETGERVWKLVRWMLNGFILLGVIFLAVALVFLGKTLVTRNDFVETEGTIVGFNSSGHPTVEYTVDGQTYRFVSNTTSSTLREGQSYRVQYPISDPSQGRSYTGSYVIPIVFGALGVGFTVIPLIVKKVFTVVLDRLAEEQEQQPATL